MKTAKASAPVKLSAFREIREFVGAYNEVESRYARAMQRGDQKAADEAIDARRALERRIVILPEGKAA